MAEVHLDEEVNPAAWLTLHFVTDNGVRFNSVCLFDLSYSNCVF